MSLHTDDGLFAQLKPQWNEVVQQSSFNTPFSLWEWSTTWWQTYSPGKLWVITFHDYDDRLIGIIPCFVQDVESLGRVLRFIGHLEVTDYMDMILKEPTPTTLYANLAQFLKTNSSAFDKIELANLQESSPTLIYLPHHLQQEGFEVNTEKNESVRMIQLPSDYNVYLREMLSNKTRKEINRKMRRAKGGEYEVDWYIVDHTHNLERETNQFLDLMKRSNPDKATFLENHQHVEFFKSTIQFMYNIGSLQLAFMTIDGNCCATYLNFNYNNVIYVYNSGFASDRYASLTPGLLLLQELIQHAIDQQRRVYNFLRGNEPYKTDMGGNVETSVTQINAVKSW